MQILYCGILSIFMFAILSCGEAQKLDCSHLRNGKFYLKGENTKDEYILERKDSIQDEINQKTGNITRFKVKWSGDCEYHLIYVQETRMDSLSAEGSPIIVRDKKFPIVRVVITELTKEFYKVEAFVPSNEFPYKGTIWFMK